MVGDDVLAMIRAHLDTPVNGRYGERRILCEQRVPVAFDHLHIGKGKPVELLQQGVADEVGLRQPIAVTPQDGFAGIVEHVGIEGIGRK